MKDKINFHTFCARRISSGFNFCARKSCLFKRLGEKINLNLVGGLILQVSDQRKLHTTQITNLKNDESVR